MTRILLRNPSNVFGPVWHWSIVSNGKNSDKRLCDLSCLVNILGDETCIDFRTIKNGGGLNCMIDVSVFIFGEITVDVVDRVLLG